MPAINKLPLDDGIFQDAKNQKISVTQLLEKLDPTENYKGTKLGELDAFQRQVLANDLSISGAKASLAEEFFKTTTSRILFPEFINRNVIVGMNEGKLEAKVTDLVATTTNIDSGVYEGLELDELGSNFDYSRVSEGAEFPKVRMKFKEKKINLRKIGVTIESTYEAIRRSRVNVLALYFQGLGRNLATEIIKESVDVLLNGDGNSNPAIAVPAATPGAIVYDDLIDLEFAFKGIEPDHILGNTETIKKVMKITEFKDPLIAKTFIETGRFTATFGNVFLKNDAVPNGVLLCFNRSNGIEQILEAGASLVEEDKIIRKQLNETVVSKVVGFSKMRANSAYYLDF